MSKLYKALVQEKADLLKQHSALTASAEARTPMGFTAEETEQGNKILARLDEIKPQLEAQEKRREHERTMPGMWRARAAISLASRSSLMAYALYALTAHYSPGIDMTFRDLRVRSGGR